MSVYSIGVDIAEVDRIARLISAADRRFIKRVFTETEIAYCEPKAGAAECFAARFAAKEAVFKAAGTGLSDGMGWHDIEVVNDDNGKPVVQLYNRTADLLKGKHVHLSLSHSGNLAIAMVVVDQPG